MKTTGLEYLYFYLVVFILSLTAVLNKPVYYYYFVIKPFN